MPTPARCSTVRYHSASVKPRQDEGGVLLAHLWRARRDLLQVLSRPFGQERRECFRAESARCCGIAHRWLFGLQKIRQESGAQRLREKERTSEVKKAIRQREAKPLVNKFFIWVQKQFDSQGLLGSTSLTGDNGIH